MTLAKRKMTGTMLAAGLLTAGLLVNIPGPFTGSARSG